MLLLSVPTILLFAADQCAAKCGMQSSKKRDELSSTEYRLFPQQFSIFFCLQGNPAQQANFVLFFQVTQLSDINSNLWVEGIR